MTGEELFDRYGPPLLIAAGWDAQPPEVQQAWEELAGKLAASLERPPLWEDLAARYCVRCGSTWVGQEGWNAIVKQGRVTGAICPDCQTAEENAEAEVNDATTAYSVDTEGRWRGTPRGVTHHEPGARSSAAGWSAYCPCGWVSDAWHRAKNSAMREARDHVRSESVAAGERARKRMRREQEGPS